jgi:hypothetical protein
VALDGFKLTNSIHHYLYIAAVKAPQTYLDI